MRKIKCGDCALRSQDGQHCGLTGIPINLNKDFCSKHNISPNICEFCGRFIIGTQLIYPEEVNHILCEECANTLSTCRSCAMVKNCDFETNSSPVPKIVQKRI